MSVKVLIRRKQVITNVYYSVTGVEGVSKARNRCVEQVISTDKATIRNYRCVW